MPPERLARAAAGAQALAAARAFSESLLHDEESTFEAIDVAYGVQVPILRPRVRDALAAVGGEPSRLKATSEIGRVLRRGHATAAGRARSQVQRLATVANEKGLTSIRKELRLAEQTLAKRYQGIADEAVDQVKGDTPARIERAMNAYRDATSGFSADFQTDVGVQFREAVDEQTLLLRLFSVDPAGLQHFQGRGIWWRATTSLKAAARTVAIGTSNEARLDAMKAFNDLYDERD